MSIHVFGRRRTVLPSHGFDLHVDRSQELRQTHFRELPKPTGSPPFHLELASILPAERMRAIKDGKKIIFHVNGDVGGIRDGVPQTLVVRGMESEFGHPETPAESPAFLYILGDCVYLNGEANEYYNQFYLPYEFYPAPIFAIPGNHDGSNLQYENSLQGFVRNFCAEQPVKMPESGDSGRTAMVQPNVYWVLKTPLLNIIGLYSNVMEGGAIREDQLDWLITQLKTLERDLPVFVTLHHPIYSADEHHSGSTHMKILLEQAFVAAGRWPEMLLSGHVHNYQRLSKTLQDGSVIPFLVTGAGGYHNLHNVKRVDGETMVTPVEFIGEDGDLVVLDRYCDDHHGFLRLEITENDIIGRYYAVPRPHEPYSKQKKLIDYFEFDWRQRQYRMNRL
jgi:acid phosphatase type 7